MGGRFRVGGLTVEVSGKAGALKALERAWAPFAVEAKAAVDAEVELELDGKRRPAPSPCPMPDVRLDANGSLQIEGVSFHAEIDQARRSVRVRGADERFGVEMAIKHLLAARLASAGGGLLVHGVALANGSRAALFIGQSGAGKSTLGKLGQQAGLRMLSDELVAVWAVETGRAYRAEGTPWNEGVPEGAPLAGVGTLHWEDAARIERQPASNLLRDLMGNVLLADPSPEGRSAAMKAQAAFVSAVATWKLHFAADQPVGPAIQWALK